MPDHHLLNGLFSHGGREKYPPAALNWVLAVPNLIHTYIYTYKCPTTICWMGCSARVEGKSTQPLPLTGSWQFQISYINTYIHIYVCIYIFSAKYIYIYIYIYISLNSEIVASIKRVLNMYNRAIHTYIHIYIYLVRFWRKSLSLHLKMFHLWAGYNPPKFRVNCYFHNSWTLSWKFTEICCKKWQVRC